MSLFLLDSRGQIAGEYADLKAIKAAAQAQVIPTGDYTILKEAGKLPIKAVPARISVTFESTAKRGPRKATTEGEPVAEIAEAEAPKRKRGSLFGGNAA